MVGVKNVKFDSKEDVIFIILLLIAWDWIHDFHPVDQAHPRLTGCLKDGPGTMGLLSLSKKVAQVLKFSGGERSMYDKPSMIESPMGVGELQEYDGDEVAQDVVNRRKIEEARVEKAININNAKIQLGMGLKNEVVNNEKVASLTRHFIFHILSSASLKTNIPMDEKFKEIFTGLYKLRNQISYKIVELETNIKNETTDDNIDYETDNETDNEILNKQRIDLVHKNLYIIFSTFKKTIDIFIDKFKKDSLLEYELSGSNIDPNEVFIKTLNNKEYKINIRISTCILIFKLNKQIGTTNIKDYITGKDKTNDEIKTETLNSETRRILGTFMKVSTRGGFTGNEEVCRRLIAYAEGVKRFLTEQIERITNQQSFNKDQIKTAANDFFNNTKEISNNEPKIESAIATANTELSGLRLDARTAKKTIIKVLNKYIDIIDAITAASGCKKILDDILKAAEKAGKEEAGKVLPINVQITLSYIHRMITKKILQEMNLIKKTKSKLEYKYEKNTKGFNYKNKYLNLIVEVLCKLARIPLNSRNSPMLYERFQKSSIISDSQIIDNGAELAARIKRSRDGSRSVGGSMDVQQGPPLYNGAELAAQKKRSRDGSRSVDGLMDVEYDLYRPGLAAPIKGPRGGSRSVDELIFTLFNQIFEEDVSPLRSLPETLRNNIGAGNRIIINNSAADSTLLNIINSNKLVRQNASFCPTSSIIDAQSLCSGRTSQGVREQGNMNVMFQDDKNIHNFNYIVTDNGTTVNIKMNISENLLKINGDKYHVEVNGVQVNTTTTTTGKKGKKMLQASVVLRDVITELFNEFHVYFTTTKYKDMGKYKNIWDRIANFKEGTRNPMLTILQTTCRKAFGDWTQELNSIIENGGYTGVNYKTSSKSNIIQQTTSDASRFGVANDRPSATRMFFITSFAKSGINANAVAGYIAPNNTSILVKSGNRIPNRELPAIKEDKGFVQEPPNKKQRFEGGKKTRKQKIKTIKKRRKRKAKETRKKRSKRQTRSKRI